jgi:hypothetical protein
LKDASFYLMITAQPPQVVLVSYIMIAMICVESLIVNRITTVAGIVNTKRTCVRKYGTLLSR